MKILLQIITQVNIVLPSKPRKILINVLSSMYKLNFNDFYSTIDKPYGNPDKILVDNFLELIEIATSENN